MFDAIAGLFVDAGGGLLGKLLHPAAAAWLPVLGGGLTGFIVLLYQEDG